MEKKKIVTAKNPAKFRIGMIVKDKERGMHHKIAAKYIDDNGSWRYVMEYEDKNWVESKLERVNTK